MNYYYYCCCWITKDPTAYKTQKSNKNKEHKRFNKIATAFLWVSLMVALGILTKFNWKFETTSDSLQQLGSNLESKSKEHKEITWRQSISTNPPKRRKEAAQWQFKRIVVASLVDPRVSTGEETWKGTRIRVPYAELNSFKKLGESLDLRMHNFVYKYLIKRN